MGKYDSQLKNYYEKQTSGKADLGLYQKQNKDGSVSASKEVQDRAAANRHIYAEIAPTLANSTNKAGYASWMKPNNDVYFGSQTFDGDAFNAARSDFMDNFMLNTKTANKNANHPKYGYDWNDPEDVERFQSGKISKKYEGTYTDDPFDQFLKAYGQASSEYFAKTYYPKAYSKVIADRAAQQRIKDFRKAVANETWSTASDPMNITGDDIAAAAQRIQLSNPIYKDIELYNPKDSDSSYDSYLSPAPAEQTAQAKEQKNRTGKLSLDDVMSDIARYQNRVNAKVEQAQEQQQEETVKTQNIINTAIADSGFSVEIDKRVGLARDSKLKEYNSNKQKKQTASDIAIAAMREAGYSNQDIQKAIRQDGRLSYSESTEGKANEAVRIARRDSSDTTTAKVLGGMDSFTQGAVDKAKKLGNMGTSAQQGFSPISMMEGYGMSAQETQAVNNYVDTTRAILETQGYNGLEIDNALRRADLGEYIPTATARTNYATYTLQECGLTDEQIQQVLATYTEEDWKNVDKDMLASDYVENSMADQLANSIISMPIRAALSIACGAVGLVDMGAAAISGRKELWKFTDDLQELSAWVTQFSHDRNHEIISTAADVGAEIMRMRATALIGSALTPAATTTSGSAAGTNFLFNFMQKNASHLPFISGAIGNYYLEAVNGGATPRMAALYAIPAGALEGYLESLEMGEVLQHTFGMNIVGKKIAASGLSANFKQFAITKGMPFVNFALGTIGEGLEEAASYYGSSIARMATWDKGYEMDFSEMWDNAKGGLLIGGIMNGLSMGAHTQSYKYASEIYKGTGGNYAAYLDSFMSAMHMENMNDVQRQALIDKYNSGEINVSRDAAINAGVEIQTNAEVVAAKKQAVESAENDAAVKVENANNKVTQAEQRLASIDDPDPVKKGKKLTQAARELTAAKAAASQTASEGQKKVDTATADYKSEAAKVKRKNAANQQLVDEYHASKYCSDIEAETDIAVEAAVTAEDIASLESLLQSEKEKLAAMPYQNSKAAIRRKDRIAKLENQITSAKSSLNAAVSPAAVEPTANTNADANTAQNGIDSIKNGVAEQDAQKVQSAEPALKDLGANTPTPAVQEAPQSINDLTPDTPIDQADAIIEHAIAPAFRDNLTAMNRAKRWIYKNFVSGQESLERFSKKQASIDKGTTTVDAAVQQLRNIGGTVDYIMDTELVDRDRNPTGLGSYKQIMTPPDGIDFDVVQEYLLNKHNVDRMSLKQRGYDKNKAVMANENGRARTAKQSLKIVQQMEQQYPGLKAWDNRRKNWWNTFVREHMVATGLISDESWQEWCKQYPNYVPTFRKIFDERGSANSTKGSTDIGGRVRSVKGSKLEVVDVRESFADYINSMVRASAKNDVILNMFNFAESHPDAVAEYCQIIDDQTGNINPTDPNLNPFDALATEAYNEAKDGQYILRCKIDGYWRAMSVSKDVYDGVSDLFSRDYSDTERVLMDIGTKLNWGQKALITGYNPFFAIRNTLRDTQTAYLNDEGTNPLSFLKSIYDAAKDMITDSPDFEKFKAYGGDRSGFFKSNEGFIKSAGLDTEKGSKAARTAKKAVMFIPNAFAKMGEVSETLNRYASAKRYLNRHGGSIDGDWQSAMLASAEGTTNFSRSGKVAKLADCYALYLNANIQGTDKMLRQYTDADTAAKTWGKTAGMAIASVILKHLFNNDDNEHYQNLSNYIKDNNYCIPNILGERDENGYCTSFIVLPKPQGYGAIIAGFERIATMWDEDKSLEEAYDGYMDSLSGALPVNSSLPWSAFKQAINNENWYGGTIEPQRMEDLPVEERYDNGTSTIAINLAKGDAALMDTEFGKWLADSSLGKKLGIGQWSPMKIDYLLEQKTGVGGDFVLPPLAVENFENYGTDEQRFNPNSAVKGLIDPIKTQFVKDPLYSNDIMGKFYDAKEDAKAAADEAKKQRNSAGIDEKSDEEKYYYHYSDMSSWISYSNAKERDIRNSEPNTKERDEKIRTLRKERIDNLKEFMANPEGYKPPKVPKNFWKNRNGR